jgi:hypothetical protein
LWLCKAYVNISTDPRKGANQKGAQFWERVATQFAAIREADLLKMVEEKDDDDAVVWVERNADSVMNRFQRTIQRRVNNFNRYYTIERNNVRSGWNNEKYIEEAGKRYVVNRDSPFYALR